MNRQYECIIVDDDEIDRLTTVSYVKKLVDIHITGIYASAEEALAALNGAVPDIAFLDIDMPGISGLQLRRQLDKIPACIFITAYPDYAVESFELAALDFIVKPLKADRFAKTAERITSYLQLTHKAHLLESTLGADTIFIKDGHEQVKIPLHEVVYLEALKDYTGIITTQKKYCVLTALGNLLKEKAFQQFVRIHRSYAVQKHYITKVAAQEVYVNNISLPVGRTYKEALQQIIL
jgi:two-component system, LytTR family, response regulator